MFQYVKLAWGGSSDETPLAISDPFDVQHRVHVDLNYEWSGNDPKSEFQLSDKIGEGSFGEVWKGVHRGTSFTLAIKILDFDHREEEGRAEIQREIDILKTCNHANIVKYFGSCKQDTKLWILMDYCLMGSIEDLMLSNNKTLSERQIAYVASYTLKGLDYLHSKQIIHRDIKAANILVTEIGEIKVADFGVSQQLTANFVSEDAIIGTPLYLSPEAIKDKNYTPKLDIWSFGITLIELADGYPPYIELNPMRAMFSIPHRPPPTVSNTSEWSGEFISFLSRCLRKDPNERPTAKELLTDPFITAAKGSEVLKDYIISSLKERERKKQSGEGEYESEKKKAKTIVNRSVRSKTVNAGFNLKDDETAGTSIIYSDGTTNIKGTLGFGTSVINSEEDDSAKFYEKGQFEVLLKKTFASISTQTDPVTIVPIKGSGAPSANDKIMFPSSKKSSAPHSPSVDRIKLNRSNSFTLPAPVKSTNVKEEKSTELSLQKNASKKPKPNLSKGEETVATKAPRVTAVAVSSPSTSGVKKKEARTREVVKAKAQAYGAAPKKTPREASTAAKQVSSPAVVPTKATRKTSNPTPVKSSVFTKSADSVTSVTNSPIKKSQSSSNAHSRNESTSSTASDSTKDAKLIKKTKSEDKIEEKINFKVGQTVVVSGDRKGVIRFIGVVKELSDDLKSTIWIGIELETPDGKNSGFVKGKHYFNCKENHGLFALPSAIKLSST